jgi:hypothetical protein
LGGSSDDLVIAEPNPALKIVDLLVMMPNEHVSTLEEESDESNQDTLF